MRDLAPLISVLCLGLALSACSNAEPKADAAPAAAEAEPSKSAAAKPSAPAPGAPEDPLRAAKIADLDMLCKAVDHDYKDGTLGDYYAGLSPATDWGKAQLAAGNESIQPARLLEKAVAEFVPNPDDLAREPGLANCRTLLEYIDDVE